MDNHTYDLIRVLAEKGEAQDVYSKYKNDATDCAECSKLFRRLQAQEEKDIEEMKHLLASHVKGGAIA